MSISYRSTVFVVLRGCLLILIHHLILSGCSATQTRAFSGGKPFARAAFEKSLSEDVKRWQDDPEMAALVREAMEEEMEKTIYDDTLDLLEEVWATLGDDPIEIGDYEVSGLASSLQIMIDHAFASGMDFSQTNEEFYAGYGISIDDLTLDNVTAEKIVEGYEDIASIPSIASFMLGELPSDYLDPISDIDDEESSDEFSLMLACNPRDLKCMTRERERQKAQLPPPKAPGEACGPQDYNSDYRMRMSKGGCRQVKVPQNCTQLTANLRGWGPGSIAYNDMMKQAQADMENAQNPQDPANQNSDAAKATQGVDFIHTAAGAKAPMAGNIQTGVTLGTKTMGRMHDWNLKSQLDYNYPNGQGCGKITEFIPERP